MKFGVVVFPGSTCEQDMIHALEKELNQEVITLWHKDTDLSHMNKEDCIILPGGFSFGDYLRCGALASRSPIVESIKAFAEKGGKVLGVCNGFQVLCEADLLPGYLMQNESMQFHCKNVFLKGAEGGNVISDALNQEVIELPIAHAEGRYYVEAEEAKKMQENGQVLFYYASANGEITEEANFNGSVNNIAGVCNANKNVFGMMPHPERASILSMGSEQGKKILEAIINS